MNQTSNSHIKEIWASVKKALRSRNRTSSTPAAGSRNTELERIAAEQGHHGPADLDALRGSLKGELDDEFMETLAAQRRLPDEIKGEDPHARLERLAEYQGITGPTDSDKFYGAMKDEIDDQYLADIAEERRRQTELHSNPYLDRIAEKQGHYGPTDIDSLYGAMEGQLDDEFMEFLAKQRNR